MDDPARATYLRWSFFAPSVVEPGVMAKAMKWEYRAGSAGFGEHESMLNTIESAISDGPWILGEQFTMADLILGGTMRYLLRFKMLEDRESFVAYVDRLSARPALQASAAINEAVMKEQGLV